ncbi:hypothetical protein B9Z55_027475 [Caenorhabditis nigoni]|uniref:Uncharacterized protein n=1 Tax=Caenorhabditis nigoni TaxID=1611254 RepID=A0A2G5SG52_9PELO|nr:hypothetical protein B9Z55_027475 [Caenorhabditis nigoni]
MSHLESPSSQKEGNSLILKELKKGFANFSNGLKNDDLPETFLSDEISKSEKLEDKLKKKKEVLESRMYQRKADFWIINIWLLVLLTMSIISSSAGNIFRSKDQPPPSIRQTSVFNVAAVIFFLLLGFEVFEGIMDKITDWKKRRNTTKKVSVEDGAEKNERIFFIATDYDHPMNRYREMIKDFNENYVPMWNRYKRLCNQYIFYYVVGILVSWMVIISTVIESFFYNTENDWQKTLVGILQLLNSILLPLVCYCATLVSFGLIFTTYMLIGLSEDFFLNGTGSWSKAFIVDTVILILLVGFIIVEKIINQIANWKRRRNTKITVSLEDGDEKKYQIFTIGNDSEDMMNRYQKLVKDLNEYYIPMWNRFKRLYDRFALCSVVTFFVLLTMLTPSIIDDFFHNTEQSLQTTFFGIAKLYFPPKLED